MNFAKALGIDMPKQGINAKLVDHENLDVEQPRVRFLDEMTLQHVIDPRSRSVTCVYSYKITGPKDQEKPLQMYLAAKVDPSIVFTGAARQTRKAAWQTGRETGDAFEEVYIQGSAKDGTYLIGPIVVAPCVKEPADEDEFKHTANIQLRFVTEATVTEASKAKGQGVLNVEGLLGSADVSAKVEVDCLTRITGVFCSNVPKPLSGNGGKFTGLHEHNKNAPSIRVHYVLPEVEAREDRERMEAYKKPLVYARVRPISADEKKSGQGYTKGLRLETSYRQDRQAPTVIVKDPAVGGFDGLIGVESDNKKAYDIILKKEMPVVLEGGVVNLFCYGHSGTGKTHTTIGYGDQPGLFRQAADALFKRFEAVNAGLPEDSEDRLILSARMTELYLDNVWDLLEGRKPITMMEDTEGGVRLRVRDGGDAEDGFDINGTGEVKFRTIESADLLMTVIKKGLDLRKVGSSSIHDQSSRSHAVLEFEITSAAKLEADRLERVAYYDYREEANQTVPNKRKILRKLKAWRSAEAVVNGIKADSKAKGRAVGGKLTLVDLAGADHDTRDFSQATKEELRESAKINYELYVLKNCMRGLTEAAMKSKKVQVSRLPWRDAKLTRFLRTVLETRSAVTIMVANVSPSKVMERDSINTLRYAQMVAGVSEKEIKAQVDKDFNIKEKIRKVYAEFTDKSEDEVDVILSKFKGRERGLYQNVLKKYKFAKSKPALKAAAPVASKVAAIVAEPARKVFVPDEEPKKVAIPSVEAVKEQFTTASPKVEPKAASYLDSVDLAETRNIPKRSSELKPSQRTEYVTKREFVAPNLRVKGREISDESVDAKCGSLFGGFLCARK